VEGLGAPHSDWTGQLAPSALGAKKTAPPVCRQVNHPEWQSADGQADRCRRRFAISASIHWSGVTEKVARNSFL